MRVAFRDLAEGRAVNPPRLRYSSATPDPDRRYFANIHAGAVLSYRTACVRAGSHFTLTNKRDAERKILDNPEPVNWSVVILYDLATGEPLAFMHETHLSGFRVGATTGLAVAECAREDAEVLGLFGTGNQAFPNCRAICAVRPIRRVQVFSPNRAHREAFVARMANERVTVVPVDPFPFGGSYSFCDRRPVVAQDHVNTTTREMTKIRQSMNTSGCCFMVSPSFDKNLFWPPVPLCCIEGNNLKITITVNYHQFILGSNDVLFLNIANITLISLWAVANTAFL